MKNAQEDCYDCSAFIRSRCPDCGMMMGHEGEAWELTKERHNHCPGFKKVVGRHQIIRSVAASGKLFIYDHTGSQTMNECISGTDPSLL